VNEPVRRIEQVEVLTQLQSPCESAPTTTTTSVTRTITCWSPASGWDDGGSVVNVPLEAPPLRKGH
jgi:hypothetical protein